MKDDFTTLLNKYLFGFGSALLLSVASFIVVEKKLLPTAGLTMAVLLLLAGVQLVVQLRFFLHLGFKDRSISRTATLIVTTIMMLIIVLGSIWIMRNLDYHTNMSGEAMEQYMRTQNKKGF